MALVRRAHDWAADHFRFIQYPSQRTRGRLVGERTWVDRALVWGIFGWAISAIWGSFLLIAVCIITALLV